MKKEKDKTYVIFENAFKAFEKGYCEGSLYYYDIESMERFNNAGAYYINGFVNTLIECPKQSDVQKWLREKHGIYIMIEHNDVEAKQWTYHVYRNFEELVDLVGNRITQPENIVALNCYEDIMELAISKALSLIPNETE